MTDTDQAQIDRFNKDLERECREVWRNAYAASCAGQSSPWAGGNGNWNADSSGTVSVNSAPGHIDHLTAAKDADTAVENYRIMVANKLRREAAPYVSEAPFVHLAAAPPPTPNLDKGFHN